MLGTETLTTFLALLSLAALAGAVLVAVGWLVAVTARWPPLLASLRSDLARAAMPLSWLVALVATAGSLWYSEVVGFTPCPLCWVQRIFMYPLVLVLGLALLRRDQGGRFYGLALALPGAGFAAYHAWLQASPSTDSAFCTLDAPCTVRHVWEFGFVSLPFMALAGFAFVAVMLAVAGSGAAPADRQRS